MTAYHTESQHASSGSSQSPRRFSVTTYLFSPPAWAVGGSGSLGERGPWQQLLMDIVLAPSDPNLPTSVCLRWNGKTVAPESPFLIHPALREQGQQPARSTNIAREGGAANEHDKAEQSSKLYCQRKRELFDGGWHLF